MRRRIREVGSYALNLAIIAVFAAFLGFALFKLMQIERQMRIEASENMLWVVTQTQREALRFDVTMSRASAGMSAADELGLNFDLLLSRLSLLRDPPQSRMLEHLGVVEEFMALSDEVFELKPLVETFVAGDLDVAGRISDTLDPLNMLLARTANAAMFAEWDELGERLDEGRSATWQIIASVVLIMVAGGLLSIRLVLTLRQSKRTEASLRREKQFSELVVGSSGEGILTIDPDKRCTLWNAAMEQLIPVSSKVALGSKLTKISGIFAIGDVQRAVNASLAGNARQCTDQPFFREDAEEPRYLDFLCSPLRSGEEVVGALMFVRDVTERHAAERALMRDRDELEKLVAERTADLRQAQEQLIAAMQELERALETERKAADFYRGFASMVSHQFRTPLSIIDSSVQRLLRRSDKVTPEEVVQRAARIRTGITRLTRLVEATLDAARLDTGQIEVQSRVCDLAELLTAAGQRQKELTPKREVVLADKPVNGIPALGDPTLVEHILSNLLSNAAKYSPEDTPIELRVGVGDASVWCSVSDEGVGIPEDEVPLLFERFYRASTAAGVAGTGIGLNLSRELARLQGGDISVATREVKGTTFTLQLPRSLATAPAQREYQIEEIAG